MLKIGDAAPIFSLHDQNEQLVTLDQLKGKWLILYFYPKDDTPGCTTEACSFSNNLQDLSKLNATVVGISPDSPESHRNFIQKHQLNLLLLCDEKLGVIKSYDAWGVKQDKEGVLRTTYLIDPIGNIQAIFRDVNVDRHFNEVLNALKSTQH